MLTTGEHFHAVGDVAADRCDRNDRRVTVALTLPSSIDMRTALLLCIACAVAATPIHGGDQLRIAVSPEYSYAPSTLRVRVRVEPSAQNRAVEVVADGSDYYRSSEIGLNGKDAAPNVELSLRGSPAAPIRCPRC